MPRDAWAKARRKNRVRASQQQSRATARAKQPPKKKVKLLPKSHKRNRRLAAKESEPDIQQEMAATGMTLRIARAGTDHWMFEMGRTRILNWWPATGTYWAPTVSVKGEAYSAFDALRKAREIAAAT